MMAWKRWTPLLWPFLRIHVRFLGCTFPSKNFSHPNRIRIQIEGSMNSEFVARGMLVQRVKSMHMFARSMGSQCLRCHKRGGTPWKFNIAPEK